MHEPARRRPPTAPWTGRSPPRSAPRSPGPAAGTRASRTSRRRSRARATRRARGAAASPPRPCCRASSPTPPSSAADREQGHRRAGGEERERDDEEAVRDRGETSGRRGRARIATSAPDQRADAHRRRARTPTPPRRRARARRRPARARDHAPQSMFPSAAASTNVQTQVSDAEHAPALAQVGQKVPLARGTRAGSRSPSRNSALTRERGRVDRERPPGPTPAISTPASTGPGDLAAATAPSPARRWPRCSRSGGTISGQQPGRRPG